MNEDSHHGTAMSSYRPMQASHRRRHTVDEDNTKIDIDGAGEALTNTTTTNTDPIDGAVSSSKKKSNEIYVGRENRGSQGCGAGVDVISGGGRGCDDGDNEDNEDDVDGDGCSGGGGGRGGGNDDYGNKSKSNNKIDSYDIDARGVSKKVGRVNPKENNMFIMDKKRDGLMGGESLNTYSTSLDPKMRERQGESKCNRSVIALNRPDATVSSRRRRSSSSSNNSCSIDHEPGWEGSGNGRGVLRRGKVGSFGEEDKKVRMEKKDDKEEQEEKKEEEEVERVGVGRGRGRGGGHSMCNEETKREKTADNDSGVVVGGERNCRRRASGSESRVGRRGSVRDGLYDRRGAVGDGDDDVVVDDCDGASAVVSGVAPFNLTTTTTTNVGHAKDIPLSLSLSSSQSSVVSSTPPLLSSSSSWLPRESSRKCDQLDTTFNDGTSTCVVDGLNQGNDLIKSLTFEDTTDNVTPRKDNNTVRGNVSNKNDKNNEDSNCAVNVTNVGEKSDDVITTNLSDSGEAGASIGRDSVFLLDGIQSRNNKDKRVKFSEGRTYNGSSDQSYDDLKPGGSPSDSKSSKSKQAGNSDKTSNNNAKHDNNTVTGACRSNDDSGSRRVVTRCACDVNTTSICNKRDNDKFIDGLGCASKDGDNDYCGRLTSTCADINSSGCCSCNSSSSSSGIVDKLCECSNSANFHCEHDKPNTHGLCNPIGNKNSSQFYNDKSNVFRTTNQTPYFKSHSPIKSALKKTFPHRPNNKCSPLSNQSNQSPARRCNQSGSENIVSSNPHPLHSTQIPIQKSHTPKPIVPLKNSNLTHHNNNTNHNNNNCNSNNKPHPYPSQSPTGPYTHHENNQHFAANSPDENEKSFHKKQNLHKTDPQNDSLLPGTPATNPYTHLQQNTRLSGSQSPDHQQYQQKRTHPENHVHRVWGDCSKNEIASIDRSDNNAHFSPQTDRENNIPCNANSYFYDEASLLDYPENAIYYINDDLSSNFSTDYGDDNSFVLGISENSINTLNEEYEDEEIFVFTHSGTKNVTFCDDDDDNDDDDSLGFHVLKTGADNTSDNNNCQRNLPSSLKGKGVRGAGKGGKEAGGARRKLRVEFAVMEGEERCEGMKRMGLFDGRRDEHGGGAGREMGGGMGGDDVDDADDEECGDVFDAKEEIENDVMLRTGSSRFRQPRVSLLGKPLNYKAHRRDMRYRWIQARIYNFLERPKTWPSWMYHFAVFALILLCLTLGVLCSIADFENILAYAIYVEILMLLAVMLEFALRLWAAGCRSRYQGKAGRLKYLRRPLCIIDMILILASVSALLLGTTQDHFASAVLSGLRFFQILRMVRMDRRGNSWKLLGSVVWAHRQELVTTLYIGVIGLVFSSYFVYLAEKDQPRPSSDTDAKPKFSNFADAIWWGVVTLCTVGYGDVVPATWGGKLIASISAIFGISFFALPAGILGSGFALKVQQQQRQKHLNRRRVPAANLIQCLWRCYAADENSMSTATWKPHLIPCPSPTSDRAFKNNTSFVSRFSTRRRDRSNTSGGGGGLGNNTTSPSGSNITTPTTNGHSPMITRHHSRRAAISNSEEEVPNVLDSLVGRTWSHLSLATGLTDNKLQLDPISFKKENSVSSICKDSEEEGDLSPRLTQLTEQHKKGIRALRKIRYFVSRRKFREALRPYDVKDVIEQYSAGHVDMLGRIKNLQGRLDQILGRQGSKSKDVYESKVCLASRVVKVERQVDDIETKVDLLVDMYKEDRKLLLTYIQHQGGMAAAAATSSGGAGGGNVMTSSQLQSCINKTSSSNNHSSSTPAPINTSFKPRPILIDKQITSEPGTPTSLSTGDHATRHPTKPIIHRNLSDLSQRIKKRVTYRSLPFNDPPSRAQSTTNFISASPNLGNSTLSPPCQLQTPDGSNQSYSVPNTDIGVSTCPTNQLSNTSTTLPLSLNSLSSTLTQSYTNTASNMSASNYNTSNTINSLPPLNNNSNNNNSNNSQNSQMKTPTNSSHNEGIKPFDLSGSTGNYQPPSNTSPPNNQFSSNPSSFFSSDLDLSSVASNRNNNNGMNNDDINNMNEESNSLFERLTNIEYLDSTPTQQHLIFEDPESSKPDDAWGPSNKPLSTLNEQRSTESDSSLPGILISSTSIPHASIPPISSCPNQTITTTTPIPLSMCASPSSSSSPSETHKSPFMGNSHNVNTSRGSNKLGGNSKIYPSVRFQDMCGGGGGGATGNSGTTSGSCSSNTDIDMNKTQTLVDLSIPGQDTIPTSGGVGGIPLTESMTAAANSGNNNSIAAGVLGGHHSDPYAILIGGNDEDINPSRRQDTIHLAHQRITHL